MLSKICQNGFELGVATIHVMFALIFAMEYFEFVNIPYLNFSCNDDLGIALFTGMLALMHYASVWKNRIETRLIACFGSMTWFLMVSFMMIQSFGFINTGTTTYFILSLFCGIFVFHYSTIISLALKEF